jgi:hypothetical protein
MQNGGRKMTKSGRDVVEPVPGRDTQSMRLAAIVCLTAFFSLSPSAFGWGREGHRLIAELAFKHINGKARAEIARLLAPGETMESVASWADEVRPQRKETSTWHYINLPVDAPRGEWKGFCPQSGCVIQAVDEMQARLRNRALPAAERAEALKFLIHFTGDLHQPMHAGDRGDRGGNDVPVVFDNRPSNLHSLWDTPLLERAARQPGWKERTVRHAGLFERRRLQKGTPADWAWEAHDISRDVVYPNLPDTRPAVIGDAYVTAAAPAIEAQLRRAGLRLAKLLNDAAGQ